MRRLAHLTPTAVHAFWTRLSPADKVRLAPIAVSLPSGAVFLIVLASYQAAPGERQHPGLDFLTTFSLSLCVFGMLFFFVLTMLKAVSNHLDAMKGTRLTRAAVVEMAASDAASGRWEGQLEAGTRKSPAVDESSRLDSHGVTVA